MAAIGQGNRVKNLCSDEASEEVVIPGGDFAAESEGILSPGSSNGVSAAASATHPHIHCLVTGGGVSRTVSTDEWSPSSNRVW